MKPINDKRLHKEVGRVASIAFIILLTLTIIKNGTVILGESRKLTIDDFNMCGLNGSDQKHLSELSDKMINPTDTKEPSSMYYDGRYSGGLVISHEHFTLSNSLGREGPYFKTSNSLSTETNGTNIIHPLNIKIGTDFKTVIKKLKLSDIDKTKVKKLNSDDILYIVGDKDSKESVYLRRLEYKYIFELVCYFDISYKDGYKTAAMISFAFDDKDKLSMIMYTYEDTNLKPKKNFLYKGYFNAIEHLGSVKKAQDFKNEIKELFPLEEINWKGFSSINQEITGGVIWESNNLALIFEDRVKYDMTCYLAVKILSNEYSRYLPTDINIGDTFEKVMTKLNADEKDLNKILGVDDVTKWKGEKIDIYSNTYENIYIAKDEKLVPWSEIEIKDHFFTVTYFTSLDPYEEYIKLNFDISKNLVSIEYIIDNLRYY